MTPRPRRDANEQNRKTRHPQRANTTTTIRHETPHETERREEKREVQGHPRAMEQEITFRAVFPSSYKNETESG